MDIFDKYLRYVGDTESPITYHRWSFLSAVGALLEKRYYIHHGHTQINPNLYAMLIGNPGTRKSSAIKLVTNLVKKAGYHNIAADKTSKEKFLEDLSAVNNFESQAMHGIDSFLDAELFPLDAQTSHTDSVSGSASMFISADEFNEFAGAGNLEFYALLGSLWDKQGNYHYKTKGGDVVIPDPIVSLLGGNTPTGFASAFPSEIIGQGFFSRLILIYGEPTGTKIAFPTPPEESDTKDIIDFFRAIRTTVSGVAKFEEHVRETLVEIYENYVGIADPRFESYTNRRFNQLLKLCLICSACRLDTTITLGDVTYANTMLTYVENYMPKALGEFGKAKNSEVAHRIMVALDKAIEPLHIKDLWEFVSNDLNNMSELAEIIRNLVEAKKLQKIDNLGFLPIKRNKTLDELKYVDYSKLTKEEQEAAY